MAESQSIRVAIRQRYLQSEPEIVRELLQEVSLSERERHMLTEQAAGVVTALREENNPSIMESFLNEYGLSTKEGVGLMCLAEALLRVPDPQTIDELIADKIEPSNWGVHLGRSSSSLVNASTWALLLTGQILDDGDTEKDSVNPIGALRQLIKRLGEPVVRTAVSQAMKMLGKQFVLGETIDAALKEAVELESTGYTYSYDMLGEAARTNEDAERYFNAYARAIERIATVAGNSISEKPGISIKLSALHPRYEYAQKEKVLNELLPRAQILVDMAAKADIGLNIDAEEADRLDLSLDIIDGLLSNVAVPSWQGFGVVVQAYSRRALPVLDWLISVCQSRQRRIMVRLVKGAYWDAEIKQAQELGLANFPVYTRKAHTDLSYLVCAQRLLDNRELIYPQFATHNAHTVSAIRYLAGADTSSYEFQRLHGMGEALHQHVKAKHNTRCRIYAPVGAHVDLLAYLVRRLLENGANSSFVNQIVNTEIPALDVARCPIEESLSFADAEHPSIKKPLALFEPERVNSKGYRINDPASIQVLLDERDAFAHTSWSAEPLLGSSTAERSAPVNGSVTKQFNAVLNPSNHNDSVGKVAEATVSDVASAIDIALANQSDWAKATAEQRAAGLQKAADLYEDNIAELCALLCRESGKHLSDGIAEVREAVDFLRYYALEAIKHAQSRQARGLIVCISPWNFPLAIFSGQLGAALAAGNVVIAKPAQQTPLIAARAITLLYEAGIPNGALQLLPGDGATIGNALVSDHRINGVCFTGSTGVAKHIEKTLSQRLIQHRDETQAIELDTDPMLIAETGGLNAMIADTTALTEQVVRDVIMSAFQSAGQRCSALRVLYIQEEAEQRLLAMLCGALDTLTIDNPWHLSSDIGPIIDEQAQLKINRYIDECDKNGQLLKKVSVPASGTFCTPAIVRVNGISDMKEEIFGPVLHVASFKADELQKVINDINASGYGLTFGLHTRIDDRVQHIVDHIHAGNIYVNRNQIGAIVGSQPFGGEGLSGTGPKAGGPHYLPRFYSPLESCLRASDKPASQNGTQTNDNAISEQTLQQALNNLSLPDTAPEFTHEWLLPGPTGESNQLTLRACGRVLVIADNASACESLCTTALSCGCAVLAVCAEPISTNAFKQAGAAKAFEFLHGSIDNLALQQLDNVDAIAFAGTHANSSMYRNSLAGREGRIVPFITHTNDPIRFCVERHVCIDTTAAGGNASLLASAE